MLTRIRPLLPHLKRLPGKIWPWLMALPGLTDRAPHLGGSPTYHVDVIIKIIRTGGLLHPRGLSHVPGVPYIPPTSLGSKRLDPSQI